jgi:hypothetical protein
VSNPFQLYVCALLPPRHQRSALSTERAPAAAVVAAANGQCSEETTAPQMQFIALCTAAGTAELIRRQLIVHAQKSRLWSRQGC